MSHEHCKKRHQVKLNSLSGAECRLRSASRVVSLRNCPSSLWAEHNPGQRTSHDRLNPQNHQTAAAKASL